jgi:peroxiredoxin Q/BCP
MFRPVPPVIAGDAAPPFSLPAHTGETVHLVDFRGKKRVIVAFYPEDDTAGCTHEMNAFEKELKRFAALKTQVLGISHNTTASQARFAAKLDLHFPLLSDPSGTVARQYGAKWLLPFFSRKTFVIDARGFLGMSLDGQPDLERIITYLEGVRGDIE